jgi:peptidoglycan/LPS O-acetylase OafA/YrhL
MENTTPPPAARLAALDVLRAFAVLLVLGRHMPEVSAGAAPAPIFAFLRTWERGGWIGVDLFFVLSGFLISGLLFREFQRFGSIHYGHFLARRGFKIYPAFYVMLGAVLWFATAHGRAFVGWPVLLSEVFFVQNYGPSLFPHTWSLAVEEHFYLLLPLLLLALRGKADAPFAAVPRVFAVVAVAALAARFLTPPDQQLWLKAHLFPTHLRIDSLLFGVMLSWWFHFHRGVVEKFTARWCWALAGGALLLLTPPFVSELRSGWYLHTLGLTAHYLASGALLLLALHFRPRWGALAFIGAHSYSIYLWHIPIRYFGLGWLPREWPPLAAVAVYFVISIAVGIAAAKLVETPFLALRDRLFPTRSQA